MINTLSGIVYTIRPNAEISTNHNNMSISLQTVTSLSLYNDMKLTADYLKEITFHTPHQLTIAYRTTGGHILPLVLTHSQQTAYSILRKTYLNQYVNGTPKWRFNSNLYNDYKMQKNKFRRFKTIAAQT